MTNDEFLDSTPREFDNRLRGFYEYRDVLEKAEWNRIRYMTEILANSTGNYKTPLKLKFPWDDKGIETKTRSLEERKKIQEMCDNAHGKYLNGTFGH